jgi:hypothetical protein
MKPNRQQIRLARKNGWYKGNNNEDPEKWPYEQIELCLEYEAGWSEGLESVKGATNPYGIYSENISTQTGWFKTNKNKAHFFMKDQITSKCGTINFYVDYERLSTTTEKERCKSCLR